MTALATADFATAQNPLSSPWTGIGLPSLKSVSGQCANISADTDAAMMYDGGVSWPVTQYSKLVAATLSGGIFDGGPAVRMSTGVNCYFLTTTTSGEYSVLKFSASSFAVVGTRTGTALAANDTLELRAIGTGPTVLRIFRNGSQVGTDLSDTDTNLNSGKAGIFMYDGTIRADNWEGGDLSAGYTLTAAQGSYALTGQNAGLLRGFNVAAAQGSYGLTGQTATLTQSTSRTLNADQGAYTVVGSDALVDTSIVADQGSYSLNGQTATLSYVGLNNYSILAAQGSYSLTGQNAGLLWTHMLAAGTGFYVLTGTSNILRYSGAPVTGGIGQRLSLSRLRLGL